MNAGQPAARTCVAGRAASLAPRNMRSLTSSAAPSSRNDIRARSMRVALVAAEGR